MIVFPLVFIAGFAAPAVVAAAVVTCIATTTTIVADWVHILGGRAAWGNCFAVIAAAATGVGMILRRDAFFSTFSINHCDGWL